MRYLVLARDRRVELPAEWVIPWLVGYFCSTDYQLVEQIMKIVRTSDQDAQIRYRALVLCHKHGGLVYQGIQK